VLASTFGILLLLPVEAALLPPLSVEIPSSEVSRSASLPAVADARSVEHVTAAVDPSRPSENRWAAVSAATLFHIVWVVGVMAFLGPVVRGLWRLRHLRHDSVPWSDPEGSIREFSSEMGIRGTVQILLDEDVRAPATFGFIRPAILIPTDAQEWSGTEMRHAMVHELEHVRRADWIVHLLARVVCALYWFHPFVWVMWRQLCLEAEHACDDAVLRGAERTEYAQQLVGLARRLSAHPVRPLLAMVSRADLSARVLAVLDARRSRGRVGMRAAAVAAVKYC
jgi:bla regulator protein BlaR1